MATTAPHTERAHARLSPSSASRWTVCTASPGFVQANEAQCKFGSSAYADEGTAAHEIAEQYVEFLGKRNMFEPVGGTPEMHEHGRAYAEYCLALTHDENWAVEQEAPLWYEPESNGHVDFFCWNGWSKGGVTLERGEDGFHVVDYKYGQGVAVSAENNKQLSIYAAAIIFAKQKENGVNYIDEIPVHLHIYQPRSQKYGDETAASEWITTWGELKVFVRDVVDQAVDVITNPNREHLRVFAPGEDTCRFCPAKAICMARTEWMLDGCPTLAVMTQPEAVLPKDVTTLSDEQLASILAFRIPATNLFDDVVEHAKARTLAGNPIPGWKLVAGNGKRDWADEEKGAQLLKNKFSTDEIYEKKLISVAKAEKLLKGQDLSKKFQSRWNELVVRKEGQPLLVPESDKRQALTPAVDLLEDVTPEPAERLPDHAMPLGAKMLLAFTTARDGGDMEQLAKDLTTLEPDFKDEPGDKIWADFIDAPDEPEVDFSCE